MKKLLSLIFLIILSFSAFAQEKFKAEVTGVVDGDTITVRDSTGRQTSVRLVGIDAPELAQEMGAEARAYLANLLASKKVFVEGAKRDVYGRLVAKVLLKNIDISLEMVKAGFAWHFKKYEKEQSEADRKIYSDAEIAARNSKKGLWINLNAIEPGEFRAMKKRLDEARAQEERGRQAVNTTPSETNRVILELPPTMNPTPGVHVPERTVHVRGYVRSDGTVVRPHTRGAPQRKN
jgi:endonuclease YncB( thermonuclease family)